MQASKQPLHVIWEFAYYCITSVQQKTLHTTSMCKENLTYYLPVQSKLYKLLACANIQSKAEQIIWLCHICKPWPAIKFYISFTCARKTLHTICLCKEDCTYYLPVQRKLYILCTCHNMIAPYLQTITCNQASIVMMQALVVASNAGPRIMMSYAIKNPNMLLLSLRLKSANFCEVRFPIWHDHNCVTATTMLKPKLCTLWKVHTECRDRRRFRGY